MPHIIRTAQLSDANAICDVLHRSIRELCIEDHNGNCRVLSEWLENKTKENMEKWISASDVTTIVCEYDRKVSGVGSIGTDGTIHLCYVAPEHVQTGVGKDLLNSMLDIAISQGNQTVNLTSTKTAKRFYEKNGFKCSDETILCFGVHGYPMYRNMHNQP